MKKIFLIVAVLGLFRIQTVAQTCLNRDSGIWAEGYNCGVENPLVYPDPVNDIINFKFGDSNLQFNISIKIYDMMGRIIDKRQYDVVPNNVAINIGYLAHGLYFYEIKDDAVIIRDRFLKQ